MMSPKSDLTLNNIFSRPTRRFALGVLPKNKWEEHQDHGIFTGNSQEIRFKRIAKREETGRDEKGRKICDCCGGYVAPWSKINLCSRCKQEMRPANNIGGKYEKRRIFKVV